ncbi:hypothetical protein LIA77_11751 [Sarocladium implicatum]|nr:hypothetical protein LIA77_11751 [Sarocladium implicatum]
MAAHCRQPPLQVLHGPIMAYRNPETPTSSSTHRTASDCQLIGLFGSKLCIHIHGAWSSTGRSVRSIRNPRNRACRFPIHAKSDDDKVNTNPFMPSRACPPSAPSVVCVRTRSFMFRGRYGGLSGDHEPEPSRCREERACGCALRRGRNGGSKEVVPVTVRLAPLVVLRRVLGLCIMVSSEYSVDSACKDAVLRLDRGTHWPWLLFLSMLVVTMKRDPKTEANAKFKVCSKTLHYGQPMGGHLLR